jgi:Secretion system C-terminal sorting domain
MRPKVHSGLLFLLLILLFNQMVYPQWTQITPYGGSFAAVAASGSKFYAGSYAGFLFMTSDNGTSWTRLGNNQDFGNINCIAADGPNLYVGCYNGLFLSPDGGKTWTTIRKSGSSATQINALAVDGNLIFEGTGSGLYLSQLDSWALAGGGIPYDAISSICVSGTKIFVATVHSGVYESENDGVSWTPLKKGFPMTIISALGAGTNYLYAGTNNGIFRTPINDNSWTKVTDETNSGSCLSFAFSDKYVFAGVQLGGVMLSSDDGTTWQSADTGMPLYSSPTMPSGVYNSAHSLAFANNYLLAATDNGIYSTALSSTGWSSADSGLNAGSVDQLIFNGTNIYAGTSLGGVFFSSDNGSSWYNYNAGMRGGTGILAWNGSDIYSWTGVDHTLILNNIDLWWRNTDTLGQLNNGVGSLLVYNSKIYIGTGDGVWTANLTYRGFAKVSKDLPGGAVSSLYAFGNNLFASVQGFGVYISTNSGVNWTAVNNGIGNQNVLGFAAIGSNLFACTDGGGVIYVTTDNGAKWTQTNKGMQVARVYSLAVSGSYLFAGSSSGVFISTDNGANWKAVNTKMINQNIYSLVVVGNYLFAGGDNTIWKRQIAEMTDVKNDYALSVEYELSQNYPNPFNPTTIINYKIPQSNLVSIKIYDLLGREIETLINEIQLPGNYSVTFNGKNLPSGVYFYKFSAGNFVMNKKMLLIK